MKRRSFLKLAPGVVTVGCILEPIFIEPYWFKVKFLRLSEKATHRVVHLSDIHHKGNSAYLKKIIAAVNSLSPDFVCVSGDLIEETKYLKECLEILSTIQCPIYGVPGNHDVWSGASFDIIDKYLKTTGGKFLVDQDIQTQDGQIQIVGMTGDKTDLPKLKPDLKTILIVHYPLFVNLVKDPFNLILAGHSHGGQLRLPFLGPLFLPSQVGPFDRGLYQTAAGPLYVNPGIGTYFLPVRLWCRPEITVIEL